MQHRKTHSQIYAIYLRAHSSLKTFLFILISFVKEMHGNNDDQTKRGKKAIHPFMGN